ncbi:MAG TPA: hypothetical protein VF321_02500, partial [Gaiellaceae bacterium]
GLGELRLDRLQLVVELALTLRQACRFGLELGGLGLCGALALCERLLRGREVAEARESLAQPFATPSFSEGLAALARARSRG